MPSVTLKDVDQHKFVKAFAAFLKKWVTVFIPYVRLTSKKNLSAHLTISDKCVVKIYFYLL